MPISPLYVTCIYKMNAELTEFLVMMEVDKIAHIHLVLGYVFWNDQTMIGVFYPMESPGWYLLVDISLNLQPKDKEVFRNRFANIINKERYLTSLGHI